MHGLIITRDSDFTSARTKNNFERGKLTFTLVIKFKSGKYSRNLMLTRQ